VDGVDGVTIQKLTIQNGTSGIHTTAATDSLVAVSNVIQNNTMGVYLNGGQDDPTKNKLRQNCIRRNTLAGTGSGSGVYSDQGLLFGKVEKNTFYKNTNAGGGGGAVNLVGGTIEDVQILSNTSSGDATFVSATGTERLNVNGNTVTGALGGGIFLDGGNADAQVTANSLQNGHAEGIGVGDGSANDHVLIFGNTITGNATDGVETNVDDALTHSQIGNNTIKSNGEHGIRLDGSNNTGNFVTGNTVTGNGVVADDNCVDPAATGANTWYGNGSDCSP
jgi:parallel beta-helix repeat protein